MKSRLTILAIGATALMALAANATSTFHQTNDETGSLIHAVPGVLSKGERAALDRIDAQRIDPLWIQNGGEAGWELRPHTYDFRNGKLVHTDKLAHDTPRPSIDSQPDPYSELKRN